MFFFTNLEQVHNYNTRAAANQSYYLPKARTNNYFYGLLNIRFQGPKVWNSIAKEMKLCTTLKDFKEKFTIEILCQY